MKVVVIHGSPRKGNTYKATEFFKKEMAKHGEIEFVDFFLPKDMPEFCCGCMNCFLKGESKCPHAKYTLPIMEQMDEADALILTTPVFALSLSGCMKSFLDHFAYAFIVHRPKESMFKKKAFILSSTVGAGAKEAMKTIATSLKFWGVNRIFTYRFGTFGEEWDVMNREKKEKIEAGLSRKAASFYKEIRLEKRHIPYLYIRMMYLVSKMILKKYADDTSLDKQYWMEKGWYQGRKSPFRSN